jgi:hypothetical protein
MPKRTVTSHDEAVGWFGAAPIPTWQAAGLSLAVIAGHVLSGSGALLFGLLSIAVIWTLHRLHARAPGSRTTADLIASVSGAAPAGAISAIQFVAYVLIGAYAARSVAAVALLWLTGPDFPVPEWFGSALAIAVVAVAAMLVAAVPTRALAAVVTVLAALGLLVYFYVALAVIAKMTSGTAPLTPLLEIGATAASAQWGTTALLVSLAVAFAGFEIPTAVSYRLRSVTRPLGLAMALVALCSAMAWVAVNMATTGDFRYDAVELVPLAAQLFGQQGGLWPALAATIAQAVAAVLVLTWGAMRVARPSRTGSPLPFAATAVTTMVLALAVSSGWADAGSKLWGVAGMLLIVLYVLAAQANSRLDDANTATWLLFALMGLVLAVVAFLIGVSQSWWPVGITVVILAAAAAWAVKRPGPPAPQQPPLH